MIIKMRIKKVKKKDRFKKRFLRKSKIKINQKLINLKVR